ncbi:xanthine dehydrogenase family protein molybdopterin-binding subunit [Bacillus velezensis]|uniref:xanthine dehydrogenase family protein molybdopterin-binding subunit n=1 Tax=Bacillus velezensis TaxID=492670 RepID=UPI000750F409|nr:xanthine dehydrogenase family protein molybdopterin-binding subunit [Bacillus velezensis]KUP40503.1 aldehyde oxidase [Bacillus velezensis]MEC1509147.1 xanthine dehydrogenase family protein molybdopterin-binding subunit [Bacillus velezensis]MEC1564943.1 xanthine dehydrogenase family protein molybdopterin-binding subunit [Bacillus velezensis]QCC37987.1 xanthine dehydrogenase family protein molybdopterin-binding subunit [Bacillus velezensis]
MEYIGKSVIRKEALEKVTGKAKYTDDFQETGTLHAKMLVSPYAHADIVSMDFSEAWKIPGVRAILGDEPFPLAGEEIKDRSPIAYKRVRYHGEPVAVVVAENPITAKKAADAIKVSYKPLPVVNSPREAFQKDAPLVHENADRYEKTKGVFPVPKTNIANLDKVRKGNTEDGFRESDVTAEFQISFNPSDHAAMETRCSIVEIRADEEIIITTSSQAPFAIKKLMQWYFGIEPGKVIVKTPLVGGAYGGKAAVQLEVIAYLASKAVGGRPVKLFNTREEDLITSPVHIGLDAIVKLGATKDGILKAADIQLLFDGGAYSDKGVDISRAAVVDCTGPYAIDHIRCDSYCMYTNHPYPSAFRGYSHAEVLFAFERTMDVLAEKLNMDPLELRYKNAIRPGDTTPTQVLLNSSTVGNVPKCIERLKELMNWSEGQRIEIDGRKIRAKGISCIWKTSTFDTNATSGVILTFNPDGSINLMSGVVEIGTGTKTVLAQILAERMKMDISKIHVKMLIDTQTTPEHWKTVGSRGTLMAGNAVLNAAEEAIRKLKDVASCVLRVPVEELEVADGKVYFIDHPSVHVEIKDIAYGYTFPNGNTIGGQIIASGNYTLTRMTNLDRETGRGKPGPEWAVGAQGIEVELDKRDYTYRITKAYSVVDIGTVLNEKAARGQVMGGMSMGIAFGGRETFVFDSYGRVLNPQLRTYRPLHYGEQPEYIIEFVETPHVIAPYGARGGGEHGLLGMPAALGNCLSAALGVQLNQLPLIPEQLWRTQEGWKDDTV